MIDILINFDSNEDKQKLFGVLKHLKGLQAISIKKHRAQRSGAQLRYYWSVVVAYVSEETGFTREETHQLMGKMFLKYAKLMPDGTEQYFVRSTSSLTTKEMTDYIEQIRTFAITELGVYVPDPNEIVYEK